MHSDKDVVGTPAPAGRSRTVSQSGDRSSEGHLYVHTIAALPQCRGRSQSNSLSSLLVMTFLCFSFSKTQKIVRFISEVYCNE